MNAVWNGQEALDYLLKDHSPTHPRPDVILMDVQMPIMDGYRATHLIRHHAPYSNQPELQAIPIVAMTASAIQGDREKCQKAGMDDYLAKPVKGKTLERMLIKWALEAKSKRQASVPAAPAHGDLEHARSSCSVSPVSSGSDRQAQHIAATNALPGTESEGDRGLRRVEAEEKAESLRNNKLIAASGGDSRNPPTRMDSQVAKLGQSTTALTEENMGKLAHEQGEGLSYIAKATDEMTSLADEEGNSIPQSTPNDFQSKSRARLGQALTRNDSSTSQQTVTATKPHIGH